jgi:hypothetical protein
MTKKQAREFNKRFYEVYNAYILPDNYATTMSSEALTAHSEAYKTALDDAVNVVKRFGQWFAPHEQSSPNMTVRLDAGFIFRNGTLTEVAAQNTSTITAPTVNPRIDRVVVDESTGAVSVITGSEAASPSAPAITTGKIPVAQVALIVGQSEIANADITDERVFSTESSGAAKAFVHFDGTNVATVRDSLNVDSITDNATSDYTVNFTSGTFSDANYTAVVTANQRDLASGTNNASGFYETSAFATGSLRIVAAKLGNSASETDVPNVCVVCFKN